MGASIVIVFFFGRCNWTETTVAIPSGVSLHLKRPIFPNLPYSPLSSPSNVRRGSRPLKQSRHVSIEKTGQYLQLNQYLLKDPIGQVPSFCPFLSFFLSFFLCWARLGSIETFASRLFFFFGFFILSWVSLRFFLVFFSFEGFRLR